MNHYTVLIVDDELELAQILWVPYLESLAYEVIAVCASGEEALAIAKRQPPDIAIVDINLATDMAGVEAAAELLTRSAVEIVFCSGYRREEAPDLNLLTEGFLYLEKPFKLEQLGAAMAEASAAKETKTASTADHKLLLRMNSKADLITLRINAWRRRQRKPTA
jgi:CheY-like chemotaxis protein